MLALLSLVVAAVFFFVAAIGESISDWNLVGWGLFFFVLGHLLGGVGPTIDSFRRR